MDDREGGRERGREKESSHFINLVHHLYHPLNEAWLQVQLSQHFQYICLLCVGLWVALVSYVHQQVLWAREGWVCCGEEEEMWEEKRDVAIDQVREGECYPIWREIKGGRKGGWEGGREGGKKRGREGGREWGVEGKRGREGECTSAHSLLHGQHRPMWRRKIPQGREGGPI